MMFKISLRYMVALLASHAACASDDTEITAATNPSPERNIRQATSSHDTSTRHATTTHHTSSKDIIELTVSPHEIISIVGIGYSTDTTHPDDDPSHTTTRHSTKYPGAHATSTLMAACEAIAYSEYACFEVGGCTATPVVTGCGGITLLPTQYRVSTISDRASGHLTLGSSPSATALATQSPRENGASRRVNPLGMLLIFARKLLAKEISSQQPRHPQPPERPTEAAIEPEDTSAAQFTDSSKAPSEALGKWTTSLPPCPTEKRTFTIPYEGTAAVVFNCIPQTEGFPAASLFSTSTSTMAAAGTGPASRTWSAGVHATAAATAASTVSSESTLGCVMTMVSQAGSLCSVTRSGNAPSVSPCMDVSGTEEVETESLMCETLSGGRTTGARGHKTSSIEITDRESQAGAATATGPMPPRSSTVVLNEASACGNDSWWAGLVGALVSGLLWM